MQSLKAIRVGLVLAAGAFFTGCETAAEAEYVPTRVTVGPPAAVVMSPGLVVAQAEPVVTQAPPAAVPPPASNAPVVDTARLEAKAPEVQSASTNQTPVIKEEVPPTTPKDLNVTAATEKVIKLAQGGVEEPVMLAYVEKAEGKFELEAEEIVYLSDLGVPSAVLTAMLKRDGDDPNKAEVLTAAPVTEANQPAPPTNIVSQAPVQPVEITTNYVPNATQVVVQQPPTVVVQQQPQTVVIQQSPEVAYFYDSLSPYGSWFYIADYGWCWQPTVAVVDRGWRPYGHRGQWVWTTSGWYWRSYYSWGWAPFHYGRWHLAGSRGWCWVPDRVWGPAWVSWRNSADYCGWAPLPPHARFTPGIGFTYFGSHVGVSFGFGLSARDYCFAPVRSFHHARVWDHCIPGARASHIYGRTVVNNRYDWDRGRVVNHGVPRERIERAINREIRTAEIRQVREEAPSGGRLGVREHVERGDRRDVVYAPALKRPELGAAVQPPPGNVVTEVPRARMESRASRSVEGRSRSSETVGAIAPSSVSPSVSPGVVGNVRTSRDERRPTPRSEISAPPAVNSPATIQPVTPRTEAAEPRISRNRDVRSALPTTPAPAPVITPNATPAPFTPAPTVENRAPRIQREARELPSVTRPAPTITTPPPAVVNPSTPRMPRTEVPSPRTESRIPRVETPAPRVFTPAPAPAPAPQYNPPTQRIPRAEIRNNPAPSYSPPPAVRSSPPPQYNPPTPRMPRAETPRSEIRSAPPAPSPSTAAPSGGGRGGRDRGDR